jgi:hypothetical protein
VAEPKGKICKPGERMIKCDKMYTHIHTAEEFELWATEMRPKAQSFNKHPI